MRNVSEYTQDSELKGIIYIESCVLRCHCHLLTYFLRTASRITYHMRIILKTSGNGYYHYRKTIAPGTTILVKSVLEHNQPQIRPYSTWAEMAEVVLSECTRCHPAKVSLYRYWSWRYPKRIFQENPY